MPPLTGGAGTVGTGAEGTGPVPAGSDGDGWIEQCCCLFWCGTARVVVDKRHRAKSDASDARIGGSQGARERSVC